MEGGRRISATELRNVLREWGVVVRSEWRGEDLQARWDYAREQPNVVMEDMRGEFTSWKRATWLTDPSRRLFAQSRFVGPNNAFVPAIYKKERGQRVLFFKKDDIVCETEEKRSSLDPEKGGPPLKSAKTSGKNVASSEKSKSSKGVASPSNTSKTKDNKGVASASNTTKTKGKKGVASSSSAPKTKSTTSVASSSSSSTPQQGALVPSRSWDSIEALVIACDVHKPGYEFPNFTDDAMAIKDVLEQKRKFKVTIAINRPAEYLRSTVSKFLAGVDSKSVRLLYFIGHGKIEQGESFLFGTDDQSISLQNILEDARQAGCGIFGAFLDLYDFQMPSDLVAQEQQILSRPPINTFVAHSYVQKAPSNTGFQERSIYTKHLVDAFQNSSLAGRDITDFCRHVCRGVVQETKNGQEPWYCECLESSFSLF